MARWQCAHVSTFTDEAIRSPVARDWPEIRGDFPILDQTVNGQPLIYFDNAATSQKPRAVIEALRTITNATTPMCIAAARVEFAGDGRLRSARERVARFIGAASADEIIFTRGTTEGINLCRAIVGRNILRAGDVVLLTEMEHHSNLVPWQLLAARTGAATPFRAGARRWPTRIPRDFRSCLRRR
jgi:cysteine desulfurase/selenocysteine lyase